LENPSKLMAEEKASLSGELELKHYEGGTPVTGTLVKHLKVFRKAATPGGSIEEEQVIP